MEPYGKPAALSQQLAQAPPNDMDPAKPSAAVAPSGPRPLPTKLGPFGHVQYLNPSSSTGDTLTRLVSPGSGSGIEKDEYLLRLLMRGRHVKTAPSYLLPPSSQSGGVFRVPDPVLTRAPGSTGGPQASPLQTKTAPSLPLAPTTASAQPYSLPVASAEILPSYSYAESQRWIGKEGAASLRSTVVAHQVAYLEQLYDLHRAIAVQKLLMRNCPEVKEVVSEALQVLKDDQEKPRGEGAKRARKGEKEPVVHPDSQFAAGPLPGEATGGDGSGDDCDGGSGANGSRGNGSGGGSTSPQPQVPVAPPPPQPPPPKGMPPLEAAPSNASQTPVMFPPRQPGIAVPQWASQPQTGMPMGPMYPPGVMSPDPMAWWYQNYARPAVAPMQQQVATAAAAAAAPVLSSLGTAPPGSNFRGVVQRWWQDPLATFGPPGDPAAVFRARRGPEGASGAADVDSMLPSTRPPPLVVPARQRRSKRKPSDPIAEASSGTTGQDHHAGPHAIMDDAHNAAVKVRTPRSGGPDANAAKLLLSFSGKGVA